MHTPLGLREDRWEYHCGQELCKLDVIAWLCGPVEISMFLPSNMGAMHVKERRRADSQKQSI